MTWRSENFFSSSRVRLCAMSVSGPNAFGYGETNVPLLDFVEVRKERHGDEDDDCFFTVANVKLEEVSVSIYILDDRHCKLICHTSRADTNCSGRSALFMSGVLASRSYIALAMLVSSSEGDCLDELFGAILLM